MIEHIQQLDTSSIEKDFQGAAPSLEPNQFNISTLLRDQFTRREVLSRIRQTVADPQVRELIDICLQAGQSHQERNKNNERLQLHMKEKRLEEEINQMIQDLQRIIRENELIEEHFTELKEHSIEELQERKVKLTKEIAEEVKKFGVIQEALSTTKSEFIMKQQESKGKATMESLLKIKKAKADEVDALKAKKALELKKYQLFQTELLGINLRLESKLLTKGAKGIVQTVQTTKVVNAPVPKQDSLFLGPVTSSFDARYAALIIAVGIIWSLILASKAYNYMK